MTTDAWGIDDGWHDVEGGWHTPPQETVDAIRAAMGEPGGRPVWVVRPGATEALRAPCALHLEDGTDLGVVQQLPPDVPPGLHDLVPADGSVTTTLLVGPGRCFLPDGLREWGVTVQVPTARSSRSWGVGDLADVRAIGEWIARQGGDVLGLSPLHAPTPVAPIAASPYYPSSRRWRSPLLIRVDEAGTADREVLALAGEARALLADPIIHRDECWARQRAALELLWVRMGDRQRDDAARWRHEHGPEIDRWATFCALAERHGRDWRTWPATLRRPDAPGVARAAEELDDRVAFHAWLQQVVDEQLERASAAGVRLVQDLAVGVDPGGADAWIWQDLLAQGFSVGAPPDEFQRAGQSWGLPPWIPWRLRDAGYRPLDALLRASMVPGGGLRIDHVMGLTRLFWVPEGGEPADGAYVRFPGSDLLELVALESSRAEAIVVGEDLGTVEGGLREELRDRRFLSTRVVWFEDAPPEYWPDQSLAMLTTHDLPTLEGMRRGSDAPDAMRDRLERLVGPLEHQSFDEVDRAIHRRLASSPSALALATLEDLLAVPERPNLPGTDDHERPNWSVSLPVLVDDLAGDAGAEGVLAAMADARR